MCAEEVVQWGPDWKSGPESTEKDRRRFTPHQLEVPAALGFANGGSLVLRMNERKKECHFGN